MKNASDICKRRTIEGKFINESLADLRSAIRDMLAYKNNDRIKLLPNYVDDCLKSYCPTNRKCFKMIPPKDLRINSILLETIKKKLAYKSDSDIAKKLLIGVFCVFNISRTQNNPPPTPYVDINKLKLEYGRNDLTNRRSEFIESAKEALDNLKTYDNVIKEVPPADNEEPDDEDDQNTSQYILIKSGKLADLINTIECQDFIILIKGKQERTSVEGVYENTDGVINDIANFDKVKNVIENFIDIIDKSNAVSAIGTLEFVDQLSKFNSVSTVCKETDIDTTKYVPERIGLKTSNGFSYLEDVMKPKD
jgi:hypothetical protein